ncbi:MAG: class I SAM-dependent methyltransferase, partial [Anaerolineae bacterium]|nr:class I SAM-dependent methyltransferase [Anaerolineae bacterium]
FEALRQTPGVRVVAADFSLPMMQVGKAKPDSQQVGWLGADTFTLPFEDDVFDAVTSGFLLRNV